MLWALSALAFLNACTPRWLRAPDFADLGANPRARVQVFTNGQKLDWHAFQVTANVVSGVPWLQPPGCGQCRVQVPRAAVDSVRVVNPADQTALGIGLVIMGFFFLMFTACNPGGCIPGGR